MNSYQKNEDNQPKLIFRENSKNVKNVSVRHHLTILRVTVFKNAIIFISSGLTRIKKRL